MGADLLHHPATVDKPVVGGQAVLISSAAGAWQSIQTFLEHGRTVPLDARSRPGYLGPPSRGTPAAVVKRMQAPQNRTAVDTAAVPSRR